MGRFPILCKRIGIKNRPPNADSSPMKWQSRLTSLGQLQQLQSILHMKQDSKATRSQTISAGCPIREATALTLLLSSYIVYLSLINISQQILFWWRTGFAYILLSLSLSATFLSPPPTILSGESRLLLFLNPIDKIKLYKTNFYFNKWLLKTCTKLFFFSLALSC